MILIKKVDSSNSLDEFETIEKVEGEEIKGLQMTKTTKFDDIMNSFGQSNNIDEDIIGEERNSSFDIKVVNKRISQNNLKNIKNN